MRASLMVQEIQGHGQRIKVIVLRFKKQETVNKVAINPLSCILAISLVAM